MNRFCDTHTASDVIGPYSAWPRKAEPSRRGFRTAMIAALAGGAGVFVHCVVPLIA